jgi:hypothetical protein
MHIVVCLDMSISTRMYARKGDDGQMGWCKDKEKGMNFPIRDLDHRLENLATYRAPTAAST